MFERKRADNRPPVPVLLTVRELGIGGCENDLTKVAVGLDRARFEPHVAAVLPQGIRVPQLRAADVPIFHFQVKSMRSLSWVVASNRLREYIRRHRIQLVHAFDAPTDLLGIPIASLARVPVIIKSHLWYRKGLSRGHKAFLAGTDRLVDAVLVNSRAAQRDIVECHGVDASKTWLCYNGVDTRRFRPLETTARSVSATNVVVGTVCALRDEKRLDILIDAFARLRSAKPELRLEIVGSGPMLNDLQAQSQRLSIAEVTHFEPTTNDVPSWMHRIDVFVLSSETESFPNALLEAMACGCCVIASRVGGVPELVRDGHNGLLFEPGNVAELAAKLEHVINNPDLRRRLAAEAARTAAEGFSIENAVSSTAQLYEKMLKLRADRQN